MINSVFLVDKVVWTASFNISVEYDTTVQNDIIVLYSPIAAKKYLEEFRLLKETILYHDCTLDTK